jgi:hypothetical protein
MSEMNFVITVSPVAYVKGCAKKLARGVIGWHKFDSCPDCQKIDHGFEGWGSNGHLQFTVPDRKRLTHIMRRMALRGGCRFRRGETIHYRGD